jgi:hypothetical protein
MPHKIDILLRLSITLLVIFIIGKTIGPALIAYFMERFSGTKREGGGNIDVLVENQKQLMRQGKGDSSLPLAQASSSRRSDSTIHAYRQWFQDLSANSKRDEAELLRAKKAMTLIDSMQWGASNEISDIARRVSSKMEITITQDDVFSALKFIIDRDLLIATDHKQELPDLEAIVELIEATLFLDQLSTPTFHQHLAKRLRLTEQSASIACRALALSYQHGQVKGFELAHQGHTIAQSDGSVFKIKALRKSNRQLASRTELYRELKLFIDWAQVLTPLPALKAKNDIKVAFTFFDADESTSFEEIKKRYKKLAAQKHPDKLSAKGIPKSFEGIAHENFTRLQSAYDMIAKKYAKD